MENVELYISLFITFFKIGLFGFGGGYAMLSLIQHDVVETHQWISVADFTDIVAISQSTPGPIAFNTATYIGYTATGSVWGSAICTIAVSLPSLFIMITISKFFFLFRANKYVDWAMTVSYTHLAYRHIFSTMLSPRCRVQSDGQMHFLHRTNRSLREFVPGS